MKMKSNLQATIMSLRRLKRKGWLFRTTVNKISVFWNVIIIIIIIFFVNLREMKTIFSFRYFVFFSTDRLYLRDFPRKRRKGCILFRTKPIA